MKRDVEKIRVLNAVSETVKRRRIWAWELVVQLSMARLNRCVYDTN